MLPIPTPSEVASFRALYKRKFGVVLSDNEAWETATRALQLFYLGTYGLKTQAPQPAAATAPAARCAPTTGS